MGYFKRTDWGFLIFFGIAFFLAGVLTGVCITIDRVVHVGMQFLQNQGVKIDPALLNQGMRALLARLGL